MMPPLEFWIRLPLASVIIIGIWVSFEPKMIFSFMADWFHKWLPVMLQKPLYDCPACMSSIWGSIIWFSTGGDLIWWVPFVFALCGLNRIVSAKLL